MQASERLRLHNSRRWLLGAGAAGALILGAGVSVHAIVTNLGLVGQHHSPAFEEHVDQMELLDLVVNGQTEEAFEMAFEAGNEFFETTLNALDGVGANVGDGQRFTRVPRADLAGVGQWANHTPARATGPNARSCTACHNQPADDGAGEINSNVQRDPLHSGLTSQFIQRNTPHTLGMGAIQRLAEEMTSVLHRQIGDAQDALCATGGAITVPLIAKGVSFGSVRVSRTRINPCRFNIDTRNMRGIAPDTVVRPFQWKGSEAFIRNFNRGASHNELGMQAVELVGDGVDGDFDGVSDEMTVGDQTALAVYLAAQPRPTTKIELNDLGLLTVPLTLEEIAAITNGEAVFAAIGCATCHIPSLTIENPTFSEPSRHALYRDATFPSGQDPVALGVDPSFPVSFDLTENPVENVIPLPNGQTLGSFERDLDGRAIVRLFGDLKRHDMGNRLAERIDEVGSGRSVFLTENLWGVGSTGPYMHDGRATTLTEAILEHAGEGNAAKNGFRTLTAADRADVIAFLDNLVIFKVEEDE